MSVILKSYGDLVEGMKTLDKVFNLLPISLFYLIVGEIFTVFELEAID